MSSSTQSGITFDFTKAPLTSRTRSSGCKSRYLHAANIACLSTPKRRYALCRESVPNVSVVNRIFSVVPLMSCGLLFTLMNVGRMLRRLWMICWCKPSAMITKSGNISWLTRCSLRCFAPLAPPISSSPDAAIIEVQGMSISLIFSANNNIETILPLSSHVPRPKARSPSTLSLKGSLFQPSPTGTTSKWAKKRILGEPSPRFPKAVQKPSDSSNSVENPNSSSLELIYRGQSAGGLISDFASLTVLNETNLSNSSRALRGIVILYYQKTGTWNMYALWQEKGRCGAFVAPLMF